MDDELMLFFRIASAKQKRTANKLILEVLQNFKIDVESKFKNVTSNTTSALIAEVAKIEV